MSVTRVASIAIATAWIKKPVQLNLISPYEAAAVPAVMTKMHVTSLVLGDLVPATNAASKMAQGPNDLRMWINDVLMKR